MKFPFTYLMIAAAVVAVLALFNLGKPDRVESLFIASALLMLLAGVSTELLS
jgi:phosphotransferase system  glucose/maltose/N-acetylglucosamine-specific IIC component